MLSIFIIIIKSWLVSTRVWCFFDCFVSFGSVACEVARRLSAVSPQSVMSPTHSLFGWHTLSFLSMVQKRTNDCVFRLSLNMQSCSFLCVILAVLNFSFLHLCVALYYLLSTSCSLNSSVTFPFGWLYLSFRTIYHYAHFTCTQHTAMYTYLQFL